MEAHNFGVGGWLELLQTIGLLFGMFATSFTLRQEHRSRKLSSMLALTANHREIWMAVINNPKLKRVLDEKVDPSKRPPTPEEEVFVQMLILQVRASILARKMKLEVGDENIEADIADLFNLNIPRFVWERTRKYQGAEVRDLIDAAIAKAGKFT